MTSVSGSTAINSLQSLRATDTATSTASVSIFSSMAPKRDEIEEIATPICSSANAARRSLSALASRWAASKPAR